MLTGAVEKFPTNTQLRFFLGTMQDRVGRYQRDHRANDESDRAR